MNLIMTAPRYGPIRFSANMPEGYKGIHLPGSHFLSWAREFGRIFMQELISDQYTIRYNIFHFIQRLTLRGHCEHENFPSRLLLKNDLRHKVTEVGNIHLREGQFTLLYSPKAVCDSTFEKNQEYFTFDTTYSVELLAELIPAFPSLHEFLGKVTEGKPAMLVKEKWASPEILDLVHSILHCPYDQNLRRFYFDNKIREYLFLQLVQGFRQEPAREKFSPGEIASVRDARGIILDDIEQHFTIRHLARKVGLNEFKLKSGFKRIL